ncbi:MAG: TIGR04086 family membrane protein [Ruminococcus sp.]|nr:TIGR04086 family membrane protein [Ruminococcus sp.]
MWYLPLSLLVGFAVLCPILAGIAGMMLFTDAPNWMISCMAAVALLFSGYTIGYFAGYHRRRHGFKTGLFCGIAFFSVLLVVGLVWQGDFGGPLRPIFVLLSSCSGGVLGVNHKSKL